MATQADPKKEGLDRGLLAIGSLVVLGAIMPILDTTVVNVAINTLSREFNTDLATIQWVSTGYMLALATVIPLTGWAADRFGTKRLYMLSIFLFVLGSALSGSAWSAESLIVFRVLQGLGGGMLMPAGMTILTRAAGPQRVGRVMSIIGVPMLLGPIIGPILGGWLVDDVSWRWIFFINVPIGIVAFIAAFIVLDRDQPQPTHRLDWLGMVLLSPGLTLLIFGLAETSSHSFSEVRAWGPILAGALLIAAFLRHSWTSEAPLIDIRTFTHTRAGAAAGVFILFAIAMFGSLLLVPLYYQSVRGQSALQSGLLLAPQGFGAMITMPIAGRLTDRYGPTKLPAAGLPLAALGLLPFAFVTATTSFVLLCGFSFILGLGMGLSMMPTMTAAMQAVPAQAIARTSTAMNIIRQSGASIGTAILSVILASQVATQLGRAAPGGDGGGFETLHGLSPAARAVVARPLADAFAATFGWAVVLLALAWVPAMAPALWDPRPAAAPATAEHAVVVE